MRVQLASDLHLERNFDFVLRPTAGAEVLVLAGDVGSYQSGSALTGSDFGLQRFSPVRDGNTWKAVLFVPGNHEYDLLEFHATKDRLRETCESLGIIWLDRQVVTIGQTRFIGTTLWSDFDAESRVLAMRSGRNWQESDPDATIKRKKAFRAANHYLRKNTTRMSGQPMLAEDMRPVALECQAWLRGALDTSFTGTTVVVTHFAPSLQSADPRYGLGPGTAGFCNSLEDLMVKADIWMHGHLHCHNDYCVQGIQDGREYRCRVVSNPLGYLEKGEQQGFSESFTIDV